MHRLTAIGLALVLSLAACGELERGSSPPAAPRWVDGRADSALELRGLRRWYLVGDELTPGDDRLELVVAAPEGTGRVDAFVDDEHVGTLERGEDGFALSADLSELGPGEHRLSLSADLGDEPLACETFVRSHPLYVVVTNDWDRADNDDATFVRQEELHERHPELVLTHFVGPYTFTDPAVSAERRGFVVEWLTRMREEHGDEVGLHIHPYCNFVEAAGLACRTSPSFAYSYGDRSGYTVFLSAYDRAETAAMLETADRLFVDNGLGKPTSFRAGGWTADLHTLAALAEAGYLADTSAANWARMEEWEGYPGAELYPWNREHWATIDETSQPYYPAVDDILGTGPEVYPILEVPDNGLLVDYVTGEEMIEMLGANWDGGALAEPRQYSIGYHPPNFSPAYLARMHQALDHVDRHLASADAGPLVYARLSDLALVWPAP